MPHSVELIHTVAVGLGLALLLGFLATRLRLPALVGYLLAGVAIGPYTPGFVADGGMASQLAEMGVMLLLFGVGLHFSLGDLLAVRMIALPGAIVQMAVATLLGMGLASWAGWGLRGALYPGLPFFADQWGLMILIAFLVMKLGKKVVGHKPRFPYLNEQQQIVDP